MKILKKILILTLLFSSFVSLVNSIYESNHYLEKSTINSTSNFYIFSDSYEKLLNSASKANYNAINETFEEKINQFNTNQNFSQVYESSIQATYYALYILNVINKLQDINKTAIADYIMHYYDTNNCYFLDNQAKRYLNSKFQSISYYPYSTLLETTCYAILSLSILGEIDRIGPPQDIMDFIWSCYNPQTSGFIGQSYSEDLISFFNVSTMDNTYYALLTLGILGENWGDHFIQRQEIFDFIVQIQDCNSGSDFYGIYKNDNEYYFISMDRKIRDRNLLSSYYSIKSLDLLGRLGLVDHTIFHLYLDKVYNESVYYFRMSHKIDPYNYTDILASALGLQLSALTEYPNIQWNGVVNFILDNQNKFEMWDGSREWKYHELINAFAVIRCLYETTELYHLTSAQIEIIANSIKTQYLQYDNGFSLLPKEFTTLKLLNTFVRSYDVSRDILEIDDMFDDFYNLILSCYYNSDFDEYPSVNERYFFGIISLENKIEFRSAPIELYNWNYDENRNEIGRPNSHSMTFYALDTLKRLYSLDDSQEICDLNEMALDIVQCQFLSTSYLNRGGFLPNEWCKSKLNSEMQNKLIFMEYTYYAMKSLEILGEFLNVNDYFGVDIDALETYLFNHFVAGHFQCDYTTDVSSILKNTYYVISLLNLIDPNNLNGPEIANIENYVLQNRNYTDIKNIYYCYKISEILNLDLGFDFALTHQLIETIYSEEQKEFFMTTNRDYIDQEIFLWVCDMAKNSKKEISVDYVNPVKLGTLVNISVTIENIILAYFGENVLVKYESHDGSITEIFELQPNNTFRGEIYIPEGPEYYPLIEGNITINLLDGVNEEYTIPIVIETELDLNGHDASIEQDDNNKEKSKNKIIKPSVESAFPIMISLIVIPSFVMILTTKKKKYGLQ